MTDKEFLPFVEGMENVSDVKLIEKSPDKTALPGIWFVFNGYLRARITFLYSETMPFLEFRYIAYKPKAMANVRIRMRFFSWAKSYAVGPYFSKSSVHVWNSLDDSFRKSHTFLMHLDTDEGLLERLPKILHGFVDVFLPSLKDLLKDGFYTTDVFLDKEKAGK